jgi:AcrR family transcriptional regulator
MASTLPFYIPEDDPPAKREILRAAMKLFSEHGLAGTSIRDIARESGYTNPALYKHFASKEELAVQLFETCHQRLWTKCNAAIDAATGFDAKLAGYIGQVLELVDEHPDAMAFLSDSARVLWPKSGPSIRRHTMIGLARDLMSLAPQPRQARSARGCPPGGLCRGSAPRPWRRGSKHQREPSKSFVPDPWHHAYGGPATMRWCCGSLPWSSSGQGSWQ